jgi:type IV pilus assembly protein PilW
MIALTIGLLLLTGLTLIFVNSSQANRELQKTAQQIENGRYASDILNQNLRLAGFYGHFHELPPAPAGLPDPCETASPTLLHDALALPVQGYRAGVNPNTVPDFSGTNCAALLPATNLQPGSDVLVIRRADTNALPRPAGVAQAGEVYLQATATQAEVQFGNGAAIDTTKKANGDESTLFLATGAPPPPAPIRKLHVHVYFVAPCSVGSGADGVCQAGDDTIPTLKRLELAAGTMRLVPLVEGIEYLKLEYGIDNVPTAIHPVTGVRGDGTVDSFIATPADWSEVIAAKVYVLARNTEPTAGHEDDKTYFLGTATVPPTNDRFRRHVYTAAVRLMNTSGRREIP